MTVTGKGAGRGCSTACRRRPVRRSSLPASSWRWSSLTSMRFWVDASPAVVLGANGNGCTNFYGAPAAKKIMHCFFVAFFPLMNYVYKLYENRCNSYRVLAETRSSLLRSCNCSTATQLFEYLFTRLRSKAASAATACGKKHCKKYLSARPCHFDFTLELQRVRRSGERVHILPGFAVSLARAA